MDFALTGMKVLDFTHVLAGPYCTQMLADMGADVIKIENPATNAEARGGGPFVKGESATFMMVNRNKRSLTLNLKDPRGKEILLKLAKDADVLVQNFRPGTMERLGLGYETLRELNRGLIYCSISGFGLNGPYKDHGGYDLMAQGLSGLMSVSGEPGGVPLKVLSICDFGTGMLSCWAILVAYIERLWSGEGQIVDASLIDTPFFFLRKQLLEYFTSDKVPGPTGWWDVTNAPYQAFETKGGDWINVAGHSAFVWPRFCELIGISELVKDPRFATGHLRHSHREELADILQAAFLTKTSDEWLTLLQQAGVPCGPINTVEQILADAHAAAREMVVERVHPTVGPFKMLGIPVKLSETPGQIRTAAPRLGEHTAEILRSLGYSEAEIETFKKEGAV
ncbi:MAG: CoA transferase [Bacteroidetes bacterium]|nr:CoA transferase [Bacteroidota bacterium]MCL5026673.1 CoA transferase [Chloroflexota bacterium]